MSKWYRVFPLFIVFGISLLLNWHSPVALAEEAPQQYLMSDNLISLTYFSISIALALMLQHMHPADMLPLMDVSTELADSLYSSQIAEIASEALAESKKITTAVQTDPIVSVIAESKNEMVTIDPKKFLEIKQSTKNMTQFVDRRVLLEKGFQINEAGQLLLNNKPATSGYSYYLRDDTILKILTDNMQSSAKEIKNLQEFVDMCARYGVRNEEAFARWGENLGRFQYAIGDLIQQGIIDRDVITHYNLKMPTGI